MKKIKVLNLLAMLTLGSSLVSCGGENLPYGNKIEEDLVSTNIIEDKYRNYYEIYVGSYCDTNNDKIGDLNGVTSKLDYIKDLGYNAIWLMPINTSNSYHKYDVKDYYEIDPKYGTMDDFKNLINECHKRNIKIIIDAVFNHSAKVNDMFKKACDAHYKDSLGYPLTEEEDKYKDFYVFYETKDDIPSGITAYKANNYSFYYEGNFSSDMPEFNLDNPYVKEEINNITDYYLDMGVDGFRLDAVKYYYYGNMNKNIEFLSELNTFVKEKNPNAYIVAECWSDNSEIKNYYNSGIDSFFNFGLSVTNASSGIINSLNLEGRMLNKYAQALQSNIDLANGYIPAPFLDNHDTIRYSSTNIRKNKFYYALLQMMNGSTFTYYGSEIGMVGSNSGTLPDQNVRIEMKWTDDDKDNCYLSGATERSYPNGSLESQKDNPHSLYNFYKKVNLIRNQNPEIARGEVEIIEQRREEEEEKLLVIKKTYNNESIYIAINFSPTIDATYDFSNIASKVVGQIVVDSEEGKYIGLSKDGKLNLPTFSIAILK